MHYLCFKSLIYAGRAHSESELSQHQSVCLSYLEKLHEKNQQVQHIAFTGIVCIAAGNPVSCSWPAYISTLVSHGLLLQPGYAGTTKVKPVWI